MTAAEQPPVTWLLPVLNGMPYLPLTLETSSLLPSTHSMLILAASIVISCLPPVILVQISAPLWARTSMLRKQTSALPVASKIRSGLPTLAARLAIDVSRVLT